MERRTRFYPQHISRCYCQDGCFCESTENQNKNGSNSKFVKIRKGNGILKSKTEKVPFSGSISSRAASKCSSSNRSVSASTFSSSSSGKNEKPKFQKRNSELVNIVDFEKTSSRDSSDSRLTDRRSFYEKLKEVSPLFPTSIISSSSITNLGGSYSHSDYYYRNSYLYQIDNARLRDLNEFRLKNSRECFSVLSRHAINEILNRNNSNGGNLKSGINHSNHDSERHVCEYDYTINGRGLLTPVRRIEDGKLSCSKCGSIRDAPSDGLSNHVIPLNDTKSQHKIIFNIPPNYQQRTATNNGGGNKKSPPSGKFPKRTVPANSLALRYQK